MSEEKEQVPQKNEDISFKTAEDLSLNEIAPYWLTALIESAGDAIVSKTLDGIITSWNKGAERIFGYTADETIGKHISMLIPPEQHNEEPAILRRIRAGERVEHYETVRVRKDGRLINISLTVSPIKTPDGEIIGASKIARDVTEIKQAEAALRESENQLRQITDAIPALVSYVDRNHHYRFVNRGYSEWFGLSTEEIVGKHLIDVIGEAAYATVLPKIERVLAGEKFTFEQFMPYLGGNEKYIHVDYIPDFDPAGNVKGFFALVQDVTEGKQAEERLRNSDARLRLALDIAETGTFEIDLLTDEVQTDDIGRKIYGWEKDEPLTFSKVQTHFHPKDRDRVMNIVAEAFAPDGEGEFQVEQRIIRTDGETRWIRVHGRVFFDGFGEEKRAVRCLGTYIDITESKLAEERIREGEGRYRMLFNSIDQGFCLCEVLFDEENNPVDYRFLEVNPAFEKMTGILNVEAVGDKTARELVPNLEDKWVEIYGRIALTGEPVRFVDNSDAMNGRWFDVYAFRVGDEPSRKVAIFFNNITASKRAEMEREQILKREQAARREAEEANRLKDEFLATVSHELRTPLNSILGWSQMLRSNQFDQAEASRAVDTIYRNAKSQAQLIEDILDVSRIITGKLRLAPKPIAIAPVIESAVEALRPAIEAKHIRLKMMLENDPQKVFADPERLQQVVWNLLSNAIKFTPDGGEVAITLAGSESEARIIVADTGKGISPEFLPFVFERFRQADGSSTRQHGGLGLGLAIVRHIVELHGGSIEVESLGENKGTTFTVRLPLAESNAKNVRRSDEENRSPEQTPTESFYAKNENGKISGLRVLLVDDETDSLELLKLILSQNGAEVKAEPSARDALKVIEGWLPDVIVSDIAMPEEDGYSFIKKLRALPPERGGKIPAVALTAYVGVKERTQVLSKGFQMYVPKPIEPTELVEVLANFMRERD